MTLFQGDGIQGFIDQRSRTPEELTRSLAMSLAAVGPPEALPVHQRDAGAVRRALRDLSRLPGWDRARITQELHAALLRPGRDLVKGAQGVGEGIDPARADEMVPKFWDEGLLIVRAGGEAGLFSAILAGWTGGRFRDQSQPVTREIRE